MNKRVFVFLLAVILLASSAQAQVFKTPISSQHPIDAPTEQDIVEVIGKLLSKDLASRINISGYFQGGYMANEEENRFEFRRAVLIADAQITDKWRMTVIPELRSSQVLEAYVEYKVSPALQVRFGQYKNPFSIENQLSPTVMEFVNLCALSTDYFSAQGPIDALVGGHSGRDQGLMLHGNLLQAKRGYHALQYNLALMNGQGMNVRDGNNHKDIIATLGYKPCKEALISASIWEGRGHAIDNSAYVPTVAIGDNYRRARWSVGGELRTSLFDFRSEYMAGRDANVRSKGYYTTGTLHVTNDIDLSLSYDYVNRNKAMGDAAKQTNYAVGASYWFYPRCRLQLAYTHTNTHDDVLNPAAGNLLQAGFQVRF